MRGDDRPDRWDHPDPERTESPDRLDSRDRLDRPEEHVHDTPEEHGDERVVEERTVRQQEWVPEETTAPPPPEMPYRAPPPARPWKAIGAIIIVAAVLAAAFGAYALLNQQKGPSVTEPTTPNEPTPEVTSPNATTPNATTPAAPNATTPEVVAPNATTPGVATPNVTTPAIPGTPAGVINGTAVSNAAAVAVSNVSAITPPTFSQQSANLGATSIVRGPAESLVRVAVTNIQAQNVTIDYSGFRATLANGMVVYPTNAANIVLAPGTTTFVTLGFPTGGQAITSLSYSAGGTSFNVPVSGPAIATSGAPAAIQTPSGRVPNTNIGFVSPSSWVSGNSAVVLVQATNNNPGAVSVSPSDFWIDEGNGTWVQADSVNSDVPAALVPGQTVPFMVGFSNVSNPSPDQVWYWPGGPSLERIGISPTGAAAASPQLYKLWSANDPDPARQDVTVVLLSNQPGVDSVNIDNVKAYTVNGGVFGSVLSKGTTDLPGNSGVGSATATFSIPQGDAVTLISYEQNGETKYIQLQ